MLGAGEARTFLTRDVCQSLGRVGKGAPLPSSAHAKSSRAVPTRIRSPACARRTRFFGTIECEGGRAFAHPTNRLVRLRTRCKASGSRQSRPAATPAQSPMRSSTRRLRSATERTACQTHQLRPTERARAQGIGVAGGNCGGERQGSGKSSPLWLSGTPIWSGRTHGADGMTHIPATNVDLPGTLSKRFLWDTPKNTPLLG